MPWIRPPPIDNELREALATVRGGMPPEYAAPASPTLPPAVARDSIVLSHARIPAALTGIFTAYNAMFDANLGLSRREQELIACVVSKLNDCFY